MKMIIRMDELQDWWPHIDKAVINENRWVDWSYDERLKNPGDYVEHRTWSKEKIGFPDLTSEPCIRVQKSFYDVDYDLDHPVQVTLHNYSPDLEDLKNAMQDQMDLMKDQKEHNASAVFFFRKYELE